eukprot:GHVR01063285.1.p1 GENE.GHVR01063285.1~~GHVR01063285.1.p1  ORF type:complete len:142 (-),score=8.31 GHVR01063285.1:13-438(-)
MARKLRNNAKRGTQRSSNTNILPKNLNINSMFAPPPTINTAILGQQLLPLSRQQNQNPPILPFQMANARQQQIIPQQSGFQQPQPPQQFGFQNQNQPQTQFGFQNRPQLGFQPPGFQQQGFGMQPNYGFGVPGQQQPFGFR